jgi:coenzyme PQQ precursor peptide PqqA
MYIQKEIIMTWERPDFEEICLNMEVTRDVNTDH